MSAMIKKSPLLLLLALTLAACNLFGPDFNGEWTADAEATRQLTNESLNQGVMGAVAGAMAGAAVEGMKVRITDQEVTVEWNGLTQTLHVLTREGDTLTCAPGAGGEPTVITARDDGKIIFDRPNAPAVVLMKRPG